VAERLAGMGHQVFILTTTFGLPREKIEGNVFRLLRYCGWDMINSHRIVVAAHVLRAYLTRKNYWTTRNIMKKITPDAVYVSQLANASVLPVLAVRSRGIPCVYDIEDYWLLECSDYYAVGNGLFRRALRFLLTGVWHLPKTDFGNLWFISNYMRHKYIAAGFLDINFRVINKGVDIVPPPESRPSDRGMQSERLLYAGRLSEEKGVHVVIDALRQLLERVQDREIMLDVIGSGDEAYAEKLQQQVRALGCEGKVAFKGHYSQSDLFQCFKKYDMVLLPSLWEEPSGGIIVEAMAHGLPVIASRIGGIPEFIDDGVTGILVAPGSPKEMAEAVERLINDPAAHQRMSADGMRDVQEKYSHERITGHIEAALRMTAKQEQ
jgi:glycosyltransferase involved in cell wall biosynthesis